MLTREQLKAFEESALAAINEMVERDVIKSKRADWRLVAAAMEMRCGSYTDALDAARDMGKTKVQRRDVTNWLALLGELERRNSTAAAEPCAQMPRRSARLLVQPDWVQQHAPNLSEVTATSPVAFEARDLPLGAHNKHNLGLRHSRRTISATVSTPGGSQSQVQGTVMYTLPPPEGESESAAKRRHKRHRSREVETIHHMSGAIEQVNATRAARTQQARECKRDQHQREREVRIVLEDLLVQLERAERHSLQRASLWCCPAGCKTGGLACGRAAFRLQCIPSAADIRRQHFVLWKKAVGALKLGEFCGPSGFAYGSAMQLRLYQEQEEALAQVYQEQEEAPARDAPAALSESEVDAIQSTFAAAWDGRMEPIVWLHQWLEHGKVTSSDAAEYRGNRSWLPADRFGPDHYPAGPSACMRRGCLGCCFCIDEVLPVYIEIRTLRAPVWTPSGLRPDRTFVEPWRRSTAEWVLLEQLACKLEAFEAELHRESLPVYLLDRKNTTFADAEHSLRGGVICLPSEVRLHLAAAEIATWSERLAAVSVRLEILEGVGDVCVLNEILAARGSRSRELLAHEAMYSRALVPVSSCDSLMAVPSIDVKMRIDAYLVEQATAIEADLLEHIALDKEKAALDKAVQLQTRFGCGLLEGKSVGWVNLRPGYIIYVPPKEHFVVRPRFQDGTVVLPPLQPVTQPGVAVILSGGFPSCTFSILPWDLQRLRFGEQKHIDKAALANAVLLPPCCGRGAACNHLQRQEHPQWPNGDAFSLDVLRPLPQALGRRLEQAALRLHGDNARRALFRRFEMLLASDYAPPAHLFTS